MEPERGTLAPELAELRTEAAADAARPAGEGEPAAPGGDVAPTGGAQEWREAIGLGVAALTTAYPTLERVYTPAALDTLAERVHAVARKYNFSAWEFLARWKEEIALLMIAGPLLRDTARELRALRSVKPAGAQEASPDVASVPAAARGDLLRPNQGA